MSGVARTWRLLSGTTPFSALFSAASSLGTNSTGSAARLLLPASSFRFYSALPEGIPVSAGAAATATTDDDESDEGTSSSAADFDSRDYSLPLSSAASTSEASHRELVWDRAYRDKADRILFGGSQPVREQGNPVEEDKKEEVMDERKRRLARALLEAALMKPDEEEEEGGAVKEEDQRSLSVGIIGAPNAGKSSLTNYMVSSLPYCQTRFLHCFWWCSPEISFTIGYHHHLPPNTFSCILAPLIGHLVRFWAAHLLILGRSLRKSRHTIKSK